MARKQAVLLIHGIGDQKPMDTLRGFVTAVWTTHAAIHNEFAGHEAWSKPDDVSRSFELRRLTTPQNSAGLNTDFFEFYWAHLMEGTSYGHVIAWARTLLLRKPSSVPAHLKGIYWLLMATLAVALILAICAVTLLATTQGALTSVPPWLSLIASIALPPIAGFVILNVAGDAARYLHRAPTNIQRRHEIRSAGIELLKELHNLERGYERIIIVGHSLGSVIGFDMLTHGWTGFNRQHDAKSVNMAALTALENLAGGAGGNVDQIQKAQRTYFAELKDNGCRWRVTDFVTLGSPLAHASVLLARDGDDLKAKQEAREFPTCLPALETLKRDKQDVRRFSFEADRDNSDYRVPHHAAVFAPTRWTNLYFPNRWILWGDLVGGPLKKMMGEGVEDVAVRTDLWGGLFSHTLYWTQPKDDPDAQHIQALRMALDLTDEGGKA